MKRIRRIIKNKRGFTLIELIVTIAVLGVLVLLASPRFFGHVQNAELTKGLVNARTIQKASEQYYMDHEDWPRLTDEPYTSEEIESYSERIFDRTGQEVNLDPEGNYYDIDYDKLSDYIQVPDDKKNYILQNPVGKVFYMENLNETGQTRVNYDNKGEPEEPKEEALYEFTSATFTNAGATGRFGPTQSMLNSAYIGSEIEGQIISENGIQLWTVPKSGTYRIETYGASGQDSDRSNGGKGSVMKGNFTLNKGEQLKILVGQRSIVRSVRGAGGGGGTFVSLYDNTPLIVSGGGGGAGAHDNHNHGGEATTLNLGDKGGNLSGLSSGGAGFSANGTVGSDSTALSFTNQGQGGYKSSGGTGGFGGGAGAWANGGGGGGYNGGNAYGGKKGTGDYEGGSGGGSYNSGENQDNSVGNTGHGKVIITYIRK